jgi:hypothetical protein
MTKKKLTKKRINPIVGRTVKLDAPSAEGKEMTTKMAMNQRRVLTALRTYRGHVAKACDEAEISRITYYAYMKDPDFAGAVDAIKQGLTDDYEEALHTLALDAKVFPAVKYFLDNHAQERGYGKEVKALGDPKNTVNNTSNIQINLATLPIETLKQLKAAAKENET